MELLLLVVLTPVGIVFGSPFIADSGGPSPNFTVFFVSVAAGCLVAGALFGLWVARPLSSRFALHGLLAGIGGTLLYLGLCSIPPATIPAVIAGYGPFWFFLSNGLRIVGATIGAAYRGRHAHVAS
jgi:zinc transporter ZupT